MTSEQSEPSSDIYPVFPGIITGTITALDPEGDEKRRVSGLVSQATQLNDEIEERLASLDRIKSLLAELPPGKYYSAAGRRVTVVGPSTAIKPGADQLAAARALAGGMASRLFTRQVVFRPVNGLREIARALLTPKKAEKVIALCEVPTAVQVRF